MTDVEQARQKFRAAVDAKQIGEAKSIFSVLKGVLIDFESLPPMLIETPNAQYERMLAREVYEYAVLLSIHDSDKESFQKYVATLQPFYITNFSDVLPPSDKKCIVMGLHLLYLLVENRLSDFHCTVSILFVVYVLTCLETSQPEFFFPKFPTHPFQKLELLSEEELRHPALTFCTQLDRHLMVGCYDQVMAASVEPPVECYAFFLKFLLEAIRINIGDCAEVSYKSLTLHGAQDVLMFNSIEETKSFIRSNYEHWEISGDTINLHAQKVQKADEVPSQRLIASSLTYATELERIV
jgi:26S proteasome regulatory subunit N12